MTNHVFPITNSSPIVKGTKKPIVLSGIAGSATLKSGMSIKSVAAATDPHAYTYTETAATDERHIGWVMFSHKNKVVLGASNESPTKDTVYSTGMNIDIAVSADLVEALLTTGAGARLVPGQRLVAAGGGLLKAHPDDLAHTGTTNNADQSHTGHPIDPTIAILLDNYVTVNAVERVNVQPLW